MSAYGELLQLLCQQAPVSDPRKYLKGKARHYPSETGLVAYEEASARVSLPGNKS